jgi:hypothetical protein
MVGIVAFAPRLASFVLVFSRDVKNRFAMDQMLTLLGFGGAGAAAPWAALACS